MREPRTADQLKEEVERRLDRACFVEIHAVPEIEWRAFVASNYTHAAQLQEQADAIVQDLRKLYVLKIGRTTAQALLRDLLKHPSTFVQIVGDSSENYRVEVRGADTETQRAAERIFAQLKSMYDIE